MKKKVLLLAVALLVSAAMALSVNADRSSSTGIPKSDQSVEFIGMDTPASTEEKADIYTKAKMVVTDRHNKTKTYNLKYHQLMVTTEVINGRVVGGLYDVNGAPLTDLDGQMASDAPDGTSLMDISGMRAVKPWKNNALSLVTQFEYKELPPNDGVSTGSFWSKLPAAMSLAMLEQNKKTGALEVVDYENISFSAVNGGWIHCGSTLSAWNTHVGAEEYEPDAKTREGLPKASGSDDTTDIASFSNYYFGNPDTANAYHYGLVPEVKVSRYGSATVVKHYAPGRFAREMQEMASDQRTAIGGDDGKNTGLFMFVADKKTYLSAGTLYAAKLTQTNAVNGGYFNVQWIKLGHASDNEIKTLVDSGIMFSDIFDVSNIDPADTTYTKVVTYTGTEWLRLKPGMEKAAAFLETRRYAALLGATTEFSKMEYIAFNKKDRKFYITISRVENGMADTSGDIQVARNDGGIILEMSTAWGQKDISGNPINSHFVGTTLVSIPELVGGWPIPEELDLADGKDDGKDAEGNQCQQDKLCGPDNIRYVDSIRTLFIGEDTSRRNNNYVWAFNIDTQKLSRILSVPMNAEATGLTIVSNYNGYAYIMSNFQHPGEGNISGYLGTDKTEVLATINNKWDNKKKAAIGYIGTEYGALPSLKK
jgi:secreted PhoX family phosphatase